MNLYNATRAHDYREAKTGRKGSQTRPQGELNKGESFWSLLPKLIPRQWGNHFFCVRDWFHISTGCQCKIWVRDQERCFCCWSSVSSFLWDSLSRNLDICVLWTPVATPPGMDNPWHTAEATLDPFPSRKRLLRRFSTFPTLDLSVPHQGKFSRAVKRSP